MHGGLDFEISLCDLKLIDIKIRKVRIMGELLFLRRPPFFLKEARKKWEEELEKLIEEDMKLQDQFIKQCIKMDKLFG